jgi:hypothetical protein
MNIRQALLEDHSKRHTGTIAAYTGNDTERFGVLMSLFTGGETRLVQRSAWVLSYVIRKHPSLLTPYLAQTIDLLKTPGLPTAVPRNILRVLQDIPLPESVHEPLMDACFRFIADPAAPIAVKAFSLTVLDNLSRTYPEIRGELVTTVQERLPYETAAFRSRARKVLQMPGSRREK